ncbi:hypothetical protein ABT061_27545 [Streptosporangium sp. NPDC002544]|uniref:hypothetical protein n=1 Tax=Streptosporangium sp. NPDC002544 TaxID=3154538 RepID=UPI003325A271
MDRPAFEPAMFSVQSSELPGFPPDARMLIVNCDTSPKARELLQREGIAVIDHRTIQRAWSRPGAPRWVGGALAHSTAAV